MDDRAGLRARSLASEGGLGGRGRCWTLHCAVSIAKEGLQKERCDNRERTIVGREDVGLEPVEETYASGSKIQREKKKRLAEFKVSS